MRSSFCFKVVVVIIAALFVIGSLRAEEVRGVVFEDANKNLKLDSGEKGIRGVVVSNQREVVKTDRKGRYVLPVDDETVIFVSKPAGYALPLDKHNLPQFYYIHQPNGSPGLTYKGVEPTGALPEAVNFPVFKTKEADRFEILVLADTQPLNREQLGYIRDDVVAELIGTKAIFGMVLGDIMWDDLSLYDEYKEVIAQVGIPFYHVPGNHDMNLDAPDDHYSLETFKRHFGPNYYSFDYGRVHFIVLDTVDWHGKTADKEGWYQGLIGEKQLSWLKNDLHYVPRDKLIVLTMHIPFTTLLDASARDQVIDRARLFEILREREHLLALAGHIHRIEHHFLGSGVGWQGRKPLHQIICAMVCGSWMGGPKDERGIPIAIQSDGAPNGYHIFRFDGVKYSERFKPASQAADYQLRISQPMGKITKDALKNTQIIVNIFDGSERSDVKCQVDDLPTTTMQHTITEDPFFRAIHTQYKELFRSWVGPRESSHIWASPLPQDLKPGIHRIRVRTTDQFGNSYKAAGIFEIE